MCPVRKDYVQTPSWELTGPFFKALLKLFCVFPRWDMLVPWRVCLFILFWIRKIKGRWLSEQSWSSWKYPSVGYRTPRWPEAIPSRTIATMLGHGYFISVNRIPKFPKSDEYRCDGSHLETVDPGKPPVTWRIQFFFEFCSPRGMIETSAKKLVWLIFVWNYTSPKTNISSENQWLEDVWRWNFHTFPLKWCPFWGGTS